MDIFNLKLLVDDFVSNMSKSKEDIGRAFHANIVSPILRRIKPKDVGCFDFEKNIVIGQRRDATFQSISFECKRKGYFTTKEGVKEVLYGRRGDKDHGLYHSITNNSGLELQDSEQVMINKLTSTIAIGFDGIQYIFARWRKTSKKNSINTKYTNNSTKDLHLNIEFIYERKEIYSGTKMLFILLKQLDKKALTKKNMLGVINTKNSFVRDSIEVLYHELKFNISDVHGSGRIRTLYKEWDRVFGVMYGDKDQASEFYEVVPAIKSAYGYDEDADIQLKEYLFSMQTFFNIYLKMLVYTFLSNLVDPSRTINTTMSKVQIDMLFDGNDEENNKIVHNFFEAHFLEWFTFSESGFETELVNEVLEHIQDFDLNTYVLKPENVQDILQEVYMELIPRELRHLMGEYFSPDWVVEHSLDMVGYNGDINKSLIDPSSGSGTFLTQALKRIIKNKGGKLHKKDVDIITNNIVGFDINPISVVSAKTNFILIVFSAMFDEMNIEFDTPVRIPIYIADSILAPVVYSKKQNKTIKIDTVVGEFEIPKFRDYKSACTFLTLLSDQIQKRPYFGKFWTNITQMNLVSAEDIEVVQSLFNRLYVLHRGGKDSFWPIILRNSFAPIMIANKFDYVVGNPPWISWGSMSKSYRKGALDVWKSYGIFEKNGYDKKTTHDDFGMAVTYVSIDQYLKVGGEMIFLLPTSFLKSTKGGEGFRKLSIIRNGQNIPFSIESVHDFSGVKLFSIPTVAIRFHKGNTMQYPMKDYIIWTQKERRIKIDSHDKWDDVASKLDSKNLIAQPVDQNNKQSAWLTLPDMEFANKVLDRSKERFYKGRKGVEPCGAKGVYVLKKPVLQSKGLLAIENDMSRQRRKDLLVLGEQKGVIEDEFVFPMLGGRNLERWAVKSNEFMLVPHDIHNKYGIPEKELEQRAPRTIQWLNYYHDGLLASRLQNGKFFNPDIQPFYRLDNIGEYTYSPYKVLWKEQAGSMSAVTIGSYFESVKGADKELFAGDKNIVVDSKVLMLALYNKEEAYYISGILNSPNIREVIDGYAISINRGTDVLKYLAIPKFDIENVLHCALSHKSLEIHSYMRKLSHETGVIQQFESEINEIVYKLFTE